MPIAGVPLGEWIEMVSGVTVTRYTKQLGKGTQWGDAAEIAACAHMRRVNIHVYERKGFDFKLTVPFNVAGASRTVAVLYVGGVHYDALVM